MNMKSSKTYDLDTVNETYVGRLGRYQFAKLAIIFATFLLEGNVQYLPIYSLPNVEFKCASAEISGGTFPAAQASRNSSSEFLAKFQNYSTDPYPSKCFINIPVQNSSPQNKTDEEVACTHFEFDRSMLAYTATEQHQIICDQSKRRALVQSFFFIGQAIGFPTAGFLADRFGRKRVIIVFFFVQLIAIGAQGFPTQFWVFGLHRLAQGFLSAYAGAALWSLGLELVATSQREYTGALMSVFFGLPMLILTGLAQAVSDWRYLSLYSSLPYTLVWILFILFVPESVRYLLAVGKREEAYTILRNAAKSNGKTIPDEVLEAIEVKTKQSNVNILHVLRSRALRGRAFIMIFIWFVTVTTYFGMTYGVGNFGGNLFVTTTISGVVEMVMSAACFPVWKLIGRRHTTWLTLAIAAVAWLGCIPPLVMSMSKEISVPILITLGMIVRAVSTITFSTIYLYTPELFPTSTRNSVLSICSMFGRLGAMLSPVLLDLPKFIEGPAGKVLQPIIYSALLLIAAGVTLALPDTSGAALPQTVEEGENMLPRNAGRSEKTRDEVKPLREEENVM